MNRLPRELKIEIVDFIIELQKGLIDDERWDFDVETCDWNAYQASFLDPTHLRTTLAVWLNHLAMDSEGTVENWEEARFRAAQYFRQHLDPRYKAEPPFEAWEIEEPE